MNTAAHLAALLDWYRTLSPDTVARVPELYAPGACFKDPFNDVRGTAAIQTIFDHMFRVTEQPRFEIGESMADGAGAFVTWTFHFRLHGHAYTVAGASHLRFGDDGRVLAHRDYWDAAEELFQKLPLVGGPVRWLRRRFRAH